ncbi:MAG: hypothetical protein DRP87_11665 [Spirochaetes bacterium]|nr:MAG: hypothetical protein DRP87_11665 [Spirochaetota bacterium]
MVCQKKENHAFIEEAFILWNSLLFEPFADLHPPVASGTPASYQSLSSIRNIIFMALFKGLIINKK